MASMNDDVAIFGTHVLINIGEHGMLICSLLNILAYTEMSLRRNASAFNMPMGKLTPTCKHQNDRNGPKK
jgi:hypothetical protein